MSVHFPSETKSRIDELCKKNGVRELSLFGSRVRGDADEGSDFDFLVDFFPESRMTLFDFSGMQLELEDIVGNKVDLVSKRGLKPRIKDRILAEARVVYEG